MKLYSVNLSPFASRARLAVYAKNAPIEVSYPPAGGLKCPEYLAVNPLGKIPCLETKEGGIPESYVIIEYLEDAFPEPSLLPGTPEQRAHIRAVGRIADLYVAAPGQIIFGQRDPATRDQALVDANIAKLDQGLGWIEGYLGDDGFAAGERFSLADCMLAPILNFMPLIEGVAGKDILAAYPKTRAYIARVQSHPAVAKVTAEMTKAMALFKAEGKFS